MASFLTKYLQARNLREALMPAPVPEGEEVPEPVLSKDVKSVLVLVDVTDLTWKEIRSKALDLFMRRCISGQIVYVYPAKIDKKTGAITLEIPAASIVTLEVE